MIRGLIIAIENYDAEAMLARRLAGVTQEGVDFREWLVKVKGARPEDVLFCATRRVEGRTHEANRSAIIDAMQELVNCARDMATEELYVLFSGHGFQYEGLEPFERQDVLVASNFKRPSSSGDACLDVAEVQSKLRFALGRGSHYYFINACRTLVAREDIEVLRLGRRFGSSDRGVATVSMLFAAVPGDAAAVRGEFAPAVLDGLRGRGRAKAWDRGRLFVTFNRLVEYVRDRLSHHEVADKAEGRGQILEITPIPDSSCAVEVVDAEPMDAFQLEIRSGQQYPVGTFNFAGRRYAFRVKPDDYDVVLTQNGTPVPRVKPQSPLVDLFDSGAVLFQKSGIGAPPLLPPTLGMTGSPYTLVRALNMQTGHAIEGVGKIESALPPGNYQLEMFEGGFRVAHEDITLHPGDTHQVDLVSPTAESGVRSAIESIFQQDPQGLVLSESLGYIANRDLTVWLAIIGASRIVRPNDPSHTINRSLDTITFDDVRPGDSPVYVLLGADIAAGDCFVMLDGDEPVNLRRVPQLPEVSEARLHAESGAHRFAISVPGWPVFAFTTHTLPNRATLIVLAQERGRPLEIRQMLLPLARLTGHLHPDVQGYLRGHRPMELVFFSAVAQSRFVAFRRVQPERQAHAQDPKQLASFWSDALDGKWLDPVMAVVAAYELVREGVDQTRDILGRVVGNLRTYFPGIPDTEAIAGLVGRGFRQPETPPLFLDGVFALGVEPEGIPGFRFDYSSPWTLWREHRPELRGKSTTFDEPTASPGSGIRDEDTAAVWQDAISRYVKEQRVSTTVRSAVSVTAR